MSRLVSILLLSLCSLEVCLDVDHGDVTWISTNAVSLQRFRQGPKLFFIPFARHLVDTPIISQEGSCPLHPPKQLEISQIEKKKDKKKKKKGVFKKRAKHFYFSGNERREEGRSAPQGRKWKTEEKQKSAFSIRASVSQRQHPL